MHERLHPCKELHQYAQAVSASLGEGRCASHHKDNGLLNTLGNVTRPTTKRGLGYARIYQHSPQKKPMNHHHRLLRGRPRSAPHGALVWLYKFEVSRLWCEVVRAKTPAPPHGALVRVVDVVALDVGSGFGGPGLAVLGPKPTPKPRPKLTPRTLKLVTSSFHWTIRPDAHSSRPGLPSSDIGPKPPRNPSCSAFLCSWLAAILRRRTSHLSGALMTGIGSLRCRVAAELQGSFTLGVEGTSERMLCSDAIPPSRTCPTSLTLFLFRCRRARMS